MERTRCEVCGVALEPEQQRFVVAIQVYAPADPLEIDGEELEEFDFAGELAELGQRLAGLDPDEALDDVARAFRFLLCRRCQRRYLVDPLAGLRPPGC